MPKNLQNLGRGINVAENTKLSERSSVPSERLPCGTVRWKNQQRASAANARGGGLGSPIIASRPAFSHNERKQQ
jgi:hypothetical protein